MKSLFSPLLISAALAMASTPAIGQVFFDFETPGQFTANFRNISTVGTTTQTTGLGNNYLVHEGPGGGAAILLYDSTPGDITSGTHSTFATNQALSVSFQFSATAATSSVGVVFSSPTATNNNLLALFNVDATSSTDTFRFFRDGADMSATAGTPVGTTTSVSTGVNVGSPLTSLTATLSAAGSSPTLTLTVGSQTITQNLAANDIDWSNTIVLIRLYDASASTTPIHVDNLSIGAIPEPSTFALAGGLAALALAACRRRRPV